MRLSIYTVVAGLMLGIVAFETLSAEGDAEAAAAGAHVMVNTRGEWVDCRVLSIDAEGGVRFSAPWMRGEGEADTAGLRQIRFDAPMGELGLDRVHIANGDVIEGKVVGVTAEHVKIGSGPLGTLDIPIACVERITRGSSGRILVETDFAGDEMAPWEPVVGKWAASKGKLSCTDFGKSQSIALPVQQDGAITVEMEFANVKPRKLLYELALYADGAEEGKGGEQLVFSFSEKSFSVSQIGAEGQQVATRRYAYVQAMKAKTYVRQMACRIVCDPAKQTFAVWIDGLLAAEEAVANLPKSGKYIVLRTSWAEATSYVRVRGGALRPRKPRHIEAKSDLFVIVRDTGERVNSAKFSCKGEKYVGDMYGTQYEAPMKGVVEIIMPTDGGTVPAKTPADACALTEMGRVTLKVTGLSETHLSGASDYLGEIKMVRKALKRLDLNVNAAPKDLAPKEE